MDKHKVRLIGGPLAGVATLLGELKTVIHLPLNDKLQKVDENPTTLAEYQQVEGLADGYQFVGLFRIDGKPFPIEFVDGPFKGIRPSERPAPWCDTTIKVLLGTEKAPFDGNGEPGGYAVYERREVNGEFKFYFISIEDSPDAVAEMRQQLRLDKLRSAMQHFYQEPNDAIYSRPPTDRHRQLRVQWGPRSANVDERLAPIIQEIWRRDFDTIGSCEELEETNPHCGMAYVSFPFLAHGGEFVHLLAEAGIECASDRKRMGIRSDKGDELTFDILNVRFWPRDFSRILETLRGERPHIELPCYVLDDPRERHCQGIPAITPEGKSVMFAGIFTDQVLANKYAEAGNQRIITRKCRTVAELKQFLKRLPKGIGQYLVNPRRNNQPADYRGSVEELIEVLDAMS